MIQIFCISVVIDSDILLVVLNGVHKLNDAVTGKAVIIRKYFIIRIVGTGCGEGSRNEWVYLTLIAKSDIFLRIAVAFKKSRNVIHLVIKKLAAEEALIAVFIVKNNKLVIN